MRFPSKLVLIAAVAAVVTYVVLQWSAPGDEQRAPPAAVNEGGAPTREPVATGPAATATPPTSPVAAPAPVPAPLVLPPPDTPVKSLLGTLKEHADAGNPVAACRLGMELARCASAEQGRPELCEGVSTAEVQSGWQYLFRAAQAGNVAAMTQFAVRPPLSYDNVARDVDGWAAYRDYAGEFMRRAIEAGDVRALYVAFFQAATGSGVGGPVRRDPRQALAYAHALLPLVEGNTLAIVRSRMPGLESEVGSAAAAAAQEGLQIRQRHFTATTPRNVAAGLGDPQPAQCAL